MTQRLTRATAPARIANSLLHGGHRCLEKRALNPMESRRITSASERVTSLLRDRLGRVERTYDYPTIPTMTPSLRIALCAVALGTAPAVFAQAAPPTSLASNTTEEKAFFEFQVEKPVASRPGNPHPRYPADSHARSTGGVVTARFVVDTAGRVDITSFEVVSTSDKAFVSVVKDVLPEMRYFPAEISGHKVRQLVEQNFRFAPEQ
jgi:TonB family protein